MEDEVEGSTRGSLVRVLGTGEPGTAEKFVELSKVRGERDSLLPLQTSGGAGRRRGDVESLI